MGTNPPPALPDPDAAFHLLVRALVDALGPTIVQVMAAVNDRAAPAAWMNPTATAPAEPVQRRIRLGYAAWVILARAEGNSVALAWLLGSNPRLDGNLPLAYIQEERADELLGAAQAFVNDVYAT